MFLCVENKEIQTKIRSRHKKEPKKCTNEPKKILILE